MQNENNGTKNQNEKPKGSFDFQEYLSVGAVESMVGVADGINQISEIRGCTVAKPGSGAGARKK